jgi:membrane fusion protein (multidrug efflux system)
MPEERAPPTAEVSRPAQTRRWSRTILLVVIPILAGALGLYWYAMSGRYVSTENAYVKSNIVAISPEIDGKVIDVEVVENQFVSTGDVLFRIDPEPFQIELDRAEAKMFAMRHEIEGLRAEFRQTQAEITEATERAKYYAQQADRQRQLQGRGIATQVRLEEAELELTAARQQVSARREKLRAVLAKLGGDPESAVELHPSYREAEAEHGMALLDLAHATLRAPVSGIVSRMRLEPGEWVEEGEPAFTIVDAVEPWVEANLKETQLTHVEVGQAVVVEIDAYPDHLWHGRVASISAATGAEFALIPPQNATGNWVKVVQRLPVRISVGPHENAPPLRTGMTATIEIDTGREPKLAKLFRDAVASVRGDR